MGLAVLGPGLDGCASWPRKTFRCFSCEWCLTIGPGTDTCETAEACVTLRRTSDPPYVDRACKNPAGELSCRNPTNLGATRCSYCDWDLCNGEGHERENATPPAASLRSRASMLSASVVIAACLHRHC